MGMGRTTMQQRFLRYYAAFVTWLLSAVVIGFGMWEFTSRDVLDIMLIVLMFTPIFPLAVIAVTEDAEQRRLEEKRRHFRVYTIR